MPNDEKKLSKSKLSILKTHILKTSGLVGYWTLGESSGTSAINIAPNTLGSHTGVVSGATLGNSGRWNHAVFNGMNDAITIAHSPVLDPATTGAFTSAYYYRPDDLDANVLPRHWSKGAHYMCHMGDSGNGKYKKVAIEVWNGTNSLEIWGSTVLEEGKWYFIVGQFDGSDGDASGKIWVNGVSETIDLINDPWSGSLSGNTNNFIIGNRPTQARGGAGGIAHFQLYNRILTQSEVQRLSQLAKV